MDKEIDKLDNISNIDKNIIEDIKSNSPINNVLTTHSLTYDNTEKNSISSETNNYNKEETTNLMMSLHNMRSNNITPEKNQDYNIIKSNLNTSHNNNMKKGYKNVSILEDKDKNPHVCDNNIHNNKDIKCEVVKNLYNAHNNNTHNILQNKTLRNNRILENRLVFNKEMSINSLERKISQLDVKKIVSGNSEVSKIKIHPKYLILEQLQEIQIRSICHNKATELYDKRDKYLGYPISILSTFLASSLMFNIISDPDYDATVIKYINLVFSILSFLFSVTRDFFKYSNLKQSHDISCKLYMTLYRSIEIKLIDSKSSFEELIKIFSELVEQIAIIEQYELMIPKKIDKNIRKKYVLLNKI